MKVDTSPLAHQVSGGGVLGGGFFGGGGGGGGGGVLGGVMAILGLASEKNGVNRTPLLSVANKAMRRRVMFAGDFSETQWQG